MPLLALGVGVALIIAGCGSDNKKSDKTTAAAPPPAATTAKTAGAAQTLKLSADPSGALKFTTTKLEAKAGKVTLEMANPSPEEHGIGVEGNGVDVDGKTIPKGETSTATAVLKPGTYEYYCTVSSHRQAGMKGTLVVK